MGSHWRIQSRRMAPHLQQGGYQRIGKQRWGSESLEVQARGGVGQSEGCAERPQSLGTLGRQNSVYNWIRILQEGVEACSLACSLPLCSFLQSLLRSLLFSGNKMQTSFKASEISPCLPWLPPNSSPALSWSPLLSSSAAPNQCVQTHGMPCGLLFLVAGHPLPLSGLMAFPATLSKVPPSPHHVTVSFTALGASLA